MQLIYLLKSIHKLYKIQLIVLSDKILIEDVYRLKINLCILKKKKKYSLPFIYNINKLLFKFKPEIIHSWEFNSVILSLPYKFYHSPYVINGSIRYGGHIKRTFLVNFFKNISYKISDLIVSNSKSGLISENLDNSEKSIVIHNGFAFDTQKKSTKYDFFKFKFNIAMVARFYPLKDYLTFIEAAKMIIDQLKYKDVGFYCIGDGPELEASKLVASDYLNKNIFFLGNRNDIRGLLKFIDIGVLINKNGLKEGISNSIMEYMAHEIPVIATNSGGNKELVKNNLSGFLIDEGDLKSLIEKIIFLIDNPIESIKMGKNGKIRIEEYFSLEKMVYNYRKIYDFV